MGHIFRAFVMLACLAVVPIVAMYGKQIQEFGRAVLETYRARVQTKSEAVPAVATGTATLQSAPRRRPTRCCRPRLGRKIWQPASQARCALASVSDAVRNPFDGNRLPNAQTADVAGGVQQASFSESPPSAKSRGGATLAGEAPNSSTAITPSTARISPH